MDVTGGIRMILTQGNLDHWFDASLWGPSGGSNVRPAPLALTKCVENGHLERHPTKPETFRLTEEGRALRRRLERESPNPIPCKFCNGSPQVTPILVHYDTPRRTGPHSMSRVACECGAIGKCRPTPEAAIESWNEPWQALVG